MNFVLTKEESRLANEWAYDHDCPITEEGAIGGKVTFQFTPTGLGTVAQVVCACGKEMDLTDYDSW